ncbi:hypothetical protein K490DRAFT_33361 [Saccharata proteae CBS 121410]|uniref:Metallo-beta-lactamase domain-containing protein n=1 Tax=Saccharata proteae CBS 121410 TaxID=1314787 RepID=A0A9P4I2C4_9PEZI|nr:hypothetical protein K490DRAFT_33361 [Saccharata proteae CBS 121410]
MSTFDGLLHDFPHIRVDQFRSASAHRPPLACFLSHVHSDHLLGLESLRAPFVYCSPATREILLRLERYPHRMNFTKGILETRVQTYKHLKSLLKTIPLETPTRIELAPGNEIQVTLFDANHCVGAVMFLFQNRDGKAALYTGDIRAETWWVDGLARHPVLLPYAAGIRRLDAIYLDTTHASRHPNNQDFPSKADGLKELLEKLNQYPDETIFHIAAWTFGYEDVWTAISSFLHSPIHLDRYRWSLYKSLLPTTPADLPVAPEASPMVGFNLGNHRKNGCLTPNPHVRLHSCEAGSGCPVIEGSGDGGGVPYVQILPIVKRSKRGTEIAEVGLGGGKGDLDQIHELEMGDSATFSSLMSLCEARIGDAAVLERVKGMLAGALRTEHGRLRFEAGVGEWKDVELEGMALQEFIHLLATTASEAPNGTSTSGSANDAEDLEPIHSPPPSLPSPLLPQTLTFPFARHSSYPELCYLLQTFRPVDIVPCTVDHAHWTPDVSIRALFGHLCSGDVFAHDDVMIDAFAARQRETQAGTPETRDGDADEEADVASAGVATEPSKQPQPSPSHPSNHPDLAKPTQHRQQPHAQYLQPPDTNPPQHRPPSPPSPIPSIRQWAYLAASQEHSLTWFSFGGLLCTRGHAEPDFEL